MPISGVASYPVISAPERRPALPARRPDDRPEEVSNEQSGARTSPAVTESRQRPGSIQFVESVANEREISERRRSPQDNLSYTAQQALRAFAENTPSPSQQLGIELAGVDTFA